jgi:hypothetical protein
MHVCSRNVIGVAEDTVAEPNLDPYGFTSNKFVIDELVPRARAALEQRSTRTRTFFKRVDGKPTRHLRIELADGARYLLVLK